MSRAVSSLCLLLCVTTPVLCQGGGCNLSEILVQPDFDPQRYSGTWFEVKWVAMYFDAEDAILVDFTQTYTPDTEDGSMTADSRGRSGDRFVTFSVTLTEVDNAKYFYTITQNNETIRVDYWIIATDYAHYSLVYGCTIPGEEGVCTRAHAWMWSRELELEDQYYSLISTSLPALCLQDTDFRLLSQSPETDRNTNAGGKLLPFDAVCAQVLMSMVLYFRW